MKKRVKNYTINSSKKAFTFLEIIFSIVIVSVISVVSLNLLSAVYKEYSYQKDNFVLQLELKTTFNYIQKKLSNAVNIEIKYNQIKWFEIDYEAFRQKIWTGFIDINGSNVSFVKTPGSKLTKLDSQKRYIYFPNKKLFEIDNSLSDDIIYFLDKNSSKIIYEEYFLVKDFYILKKENSNLYLYRNNKKIPLLNRVTTFEIDSKYNLKICKEKVCLKRRLLVY